MNFYEVMELGELKKCTIQVLFRFKFLVSGPHAPAVSPCWLAGAALEPAQGVHFLFFEAARGGGFLI